jgi:hypothetical protein
MKSSDFDQLRSRPLLALGCRTELSAFTESLGNRTIRGHYKTSADGPKPILPTHFEL